MTLTALTDHTAIEALLERFIAVDPVRATMLGTIGRSLEDTAWAASDGAGLAVRSTSEFPVVIAGRWTEDARRVLAELLRDLADVRGLSGVETEVSPLCDAITNGRASDSIRQRLFRLDRLIEPIGVPGTASVAGATHRALAREWFAAFVTEAHDVARSSDALADRALDGDGLWLWADADGTPVSMAARRPVIAGSARIGPVYTPPEQRGHGYGSGVTAAATRSVLDEGAVPVLFTDLANPTSNKIYQLLGYRPVEDRVVVTFE